MEKRVALRHSVVRNLCIAPQLLYHCLCGQAHERLFKADQDTLTRELTDLPRLSAIRKINQLIKRTNIVRAHACVLR